MWYCSYHRFPLDVYHIVKNFGGKKFGELKFICIGNVMEIVKIGEKTWQNAVTP